VRRRERERERWKSEFLLMLPRCQLRFSRVGLELLFVALLILFRFWIMPSTPIVVWISCWACQLSMIPLGYSGLMGTEFSCLVSGNGGEGSPDAGRRHDGVTPPSQTPMDAEGVLQRKTRKIPPFCREIPPTIALRYLLLRRDSSYVVDGGFTMSRAIFRLPPFVVEHSYTPQKPESFIGWERRSRRPVVEYDQLTTQMLYISRGVRFLLLSRAYYWCKLRRLRSLHATR
jgi:hypothetical protein